MEAGSAPFACPAGLIGTVPGMPDQASTPAPLPSPATAEEAAVIGAVWDLAVRNGRWPNLSEVDAVTRHQGVDVHEMAHNISPDLVHGVSPLQHQVGPDSGIALTVAGVAAVGDRTEPFVDEFFRALRIAAVEELRVGTVAVLTAEMLRTTTDDGERPDARRYLDLDFAQTEETTRTVGLMLLVQSWGLTFYRNGGIRREDAGNGSFDEVHDWSFEVTHRARYLTDVRTVQDYLTVTAPKPPAVKPAAASQDSGDGAEPPGLPGLRLDHLHPDILEPAKGRWQQGFYGDAVLRASERLIEVVRDRIGRPDLSGKDLWGVAFGVSQLPPGGQRLRWPGPDTDHSASSVRKGLIQLASGIQMAVRNPAAHTTAEMDATDAYEQLNALSMLARLAGKCEVVTEPPSQPC